MKKYITNETKENPSIRDERSIFYEELGREYSIPIRLFRTSDGRVEELPLIIALTTFYVTNKIMNKMHLSFAFENTYPMYNIRNRYIGYTDTSGEFIDKRTLRIKLEDFISRVLYGR